MSKGIDPKSDDYSAFDGTSLLDLLHAKKIVRVFVAGVATEHCVLATVLDARRHGFGVVVLGDAIRGIDGQQDEGTRAIREMMLSGAVFFERGRGLYAHVKAPPPIKQQIHYIGNYGFGIELIVPFEEAVERVSQALRNEGFGIVSDIDVAATVSSKIGVSMPPYRILGACNPTLAHQAIHSNPATGLFLPCNVVVRRDDHGRVFIEFMDPTVLGILMADSEILAVAAQVRRRLRRAIAWI